MKSKFAPLALGVVIAILLSFLPIYPQWVEGREFTQSGESLYHELQFVSMHEYYEYAQYARTAWSEATKVVYIFLAIVNPLVILFLSWLAVRALRKWIIRSMRRINMTEYHIAQINIGRILAPIDDPLMADFVSQLSPVNALADASPGFVWRLQTESGDATSIRVYEDEMVAINMSVWESVESLREYVYKSAHSGVLRDRKRWFEKFDGPYMALWWVPAGHIPTPLEGKARLDYLREHGDSSYAFSFKNVFPEPVE